ncbi:MAG: hypothetical protein ACTS5A_02320 [Candidatus Hodgkinia cicadicola]
MTLRGRKLRELRSYLRMLARGASIGVFWPRWSGTEVKVKRGFEWPMDAESRTEGEPWN